MTLTLEIAPEIERALEVRARRRGLDVAALPMHPYFAQARAFVAHCVAVKADMIAPPLWESEVDGSIRLAISAPRSHPA